MKRRLFSTLLVFTSIFCNANYTPYSDTSVSEALTHRKALIDNDWQFCLLDSLSPNLLDAHTWQTINLPHDWSMELLYDKNAASGNDGGYVGTGKGWYKKILNVPAIEPNKRYSLLFEGVYMDADVSINGHDVGSQPYGYTTFICDITPYIEKGLNSVLVTVDNSKQKNSRWYTGSGIYRHVWLVVSDATHIANDGIYITTPEVTQEAATVHLNVEIINSLPEKRKVDVDVSIFDGENCLGKTSKVLALNANDADNIDFSFNVSNPNLWSPDAPNLYVAKIDVKFDGKTIDSLSETFGIRKFEFDAQNGLRLNGEPINLYGGCVHHDNGVLGARSYDAAEARKVRLMKEAGFNAVRTSHNPPSPAFLEECDRQGLIVVDEIFDGWRDSKTSHDYSELFDQWWRHDLSSMIRRDRNHPSIMAWSVGNEVIERKKLEVVTTARNLVGLCKELDPTRPVTSALASWDDDWAIYDPLAEAHDIVGYNYMIHKAESDHEREPDRVMWQTESFPRDAYSNWSKVNDYPYVIGDFVWTAIDYLGEAGIGRHYYEGEVEGEHWERPLWPWHGALCGDIDITGYRRPISHYRQMLFVPETTDSIYMAVREPDGYIGKIRQTLWGTYPTYESWTWPGHEGKDIEVEIYSMYPAVKLYLNDELVGECDVNRDTEYKATICLPYRPGVLRTVGVAEDGAKSKNSPTLITASDPYAIRLTPDRDTYDTSGLDLAYVTIEVVDKNGTVVPTPETFIECEIKGDAEILATGSADMKDKLPYRYNKRLTSKGRAIAVVRMPNKKGKSKLIVSSPGLKKSVITLSATPKPVLDK